MDKYCIVDGYKINPREIPLVLGNDNDEGFQMHVYEKAHEIFIKKKYKNIIDIGCGTGFKLMKFFIEYETLGIEIPENYKYLRKLYKNRNWMVADYSSLPDKHYDMIICADVIEHVLEPDIIMNYIKKTKPNMIVLSTPSRELLPRYTDNWNAMHGPPFNGHHIREWTSGEFLQYVYKWFPLSDYQLYDLFIHGNTGITVIIENKMPEIKKNLILIMDDMYKHFYPRLIYSDFCWLLADHATRVYNLSARQLNLTRPSCNPIQGHSVCELEIDGEWICFDPAYNVCLSRPAAKFHDDCFVFYPDYIKEKHYDEFKELFSNITYHY
jgi:SAM-dependent methyltransferase